MGCLPPSPQPLQPFPAMLPERFPDGKEQAVGTTQIVDSALFEVPIKGMISVSPDFASSHT